MATVYPPPPGPGGQQGANRDGLPPRTTSSGASQSSRKPPPLRTQASAPSLSADGRRMPPPRSQSPYGQPPPRTPVNGNLPPRSPIDGRSPQFPGRGGPPSNRPPMNGREPSQRNQYPPRGGLSPGRPPAGRGPPRGPPPPMNAMGADQAPRSPRPLPQRKSSRDPSMGSPAIPQTTAPPTPSLSNRPSVSRPPRSSSASSSSQPSQPFIPPTADMPRPPTSSDSTSPQSTESGPFSRTLDTARPSMSSETQSSLTSPTVTSRPGGHSPESVPTVKATKLRSPTDPLPQKSLSVRESTFLATRTDIPALRESALTALSSPGPLTTSITSPKHLSLKTDTSSFSDYSGGTTRRLEGLASIKAGLSAEDLSVEDCINMYTDDFRHQDSARNSDASKTRLSAISDAKQEAEKLPAPKLPALDLIDQEAHRASSGIANPIRSSADIMAGKYDVRVVQSMPKMPASNAARDRYGFKKENQFISIAQYDAWSGYYSKYVDRRRVKWNELMKQYNLPIEDPTHFPPRSDKVKRYVRKGIPPEWRGAAWFYYAGGPAKMASTPGLYSTLAAKADAGELSDGDRDHIERDLHRTFPDNVYFKPDPAGMGPRDSKLYNAPPGLAINGQMLEETPIINSLRRVLRAFAINFPRIGYCQSLNFLAGMALLFLNGNEEKAFYLLSILTTEHLPGTHGLALEGANVDIGVLMSSLRDTLPIMWAKLDDRQDNRTEIRKGDMRLATGLPTVSLATTAWFMSCFVGTLPIETACRVWDCLFYEGSKTLFRVGLGIFKLGERDIMRLADPMEVFQVIQTLPRRLLDANAMMESAFGRKMEGRGLLSQEIVEKRRAERRQLYKSQREQFQNGAPLSPTTSNGDSDKSSRLNRAKSTLQRFKPRRTDD